MLYDLDFFRQSLSESGSIIYGEIANFHCRNCIFEFINGFNVLKNLYCTLTVQSQQLLSAIPTILLNF
jgi:hypothetical protein